MIIIEHIEEITKHLSEHSAHALMYKVLSDNDMAHILFQLQYD